MDGPTLNLLSRFRAQVVSDVKSKLKDDSSSDTETENGPIETEDESTDKTGNETGSDTESDNGSGTGSMTDSSICEPQPDIPGPRPTAILRRKSMVTSLGDGSSGLRRRNNVLRRRSDNFGVNF